MEIRTYEYTKGIASSIPAGWGWSSGGAALISNGATYTIEENKEYSFNAEFDQNVVKYSITQNITGSGSLEVTSESVAGYRISVGYTPSDGCELTSFSVTKADNSNVSVNYDESKDKYYFTMPAANVTVHAVFTANGYTVHFDANANDATGTMANQTIRTGTTEALTTNAFSRTNYVFAGWNTASNGSGTAYADGASVTDLALLGETITLYAQWKATYTVHFDANATDATGTMANQTFIVGRSQAPTSNGFSRTNYVFAGWNTASDGSGTAYADGASVTDLTTMVGATITLTAQWTPDPAHFSQSGDTYTIHTAGGWNVFCDLLAENTKGYFSGKTVKLDADITVTRMAGGDSHDFTGTFDGGGHTLTFSHTATDNYCAPFRHVQGATAETPAVISNLNVVSTVTADDYRHPAGLIALQSGHVNVTDCNVEAHINCTIGTANPTNLYPAALVSQSNGVLTVSGCTTSGQIATDGKYAAGLIGIVQNTATIENCRVSVTIQSSTSGDGTHGGLVASQASKTTINITGCLFDGSLLGSATSSCGGFIGWRGATATIYNSLFAPAEVTVQNASSATFARNTADTYNCYYTRLFNDGTNHVPALADDTVSPTKWHNGKATHTVAAGTDVTIGAIALTGDATQYTVSGITAYSGGGLQRGETLYYGSGDQLALTLRNTAIGAPSQGYARGWGLRVLCSGRAVLRWIGKGGRVESCGH